MTKDHQVLGLLAVSLASLGTFIPGLIEIVICISEPTARFHCTIAFGRHDTARPGFTVHRS